VKADELEAALNGLVAELISSGAQDESLGEFVPARGFGPFASAEKFRSLGRAWRLGVLLVDAEARLYSTGELTRAIAPGRAAVNRSPLGERRRALRLAASRTFPKGEVVNFGYLEIDTSAEAVAAGSGPLSVEGDEVMVRLESGAAGLAELERYLTNRVALLEGGADEVFS